MSKLFGRNARQPTERPPLWQRWRFEWCRMRTGFDAQACGQLAQAQQQVTLLGVA
jgi:hypothetical protein